MKFSSLPCIVFLVSLSASGLIAAPTPAPATASESLITNGDCESPTGWPIGKGVSLGEEAGNHFLRLESVETGKEVQAYRPVKVPTACKTLELAFRARYDNIIPGTERWHDGRLILHFKDASGQIMKPDPKPMTFKGSSNGWTEKSMKIDVPEGAAVLEFMPALFQVASGTLDLDDIRLTVVE